MLSLFHSRSKNGKRWIQKTGLETSYHKSQSDNTMSVLSVCSSYGPNCSNRFNSLREVPAYSNFVQERFERCLDLYLCPRQRKMRVNTLMSPILILRFPFFHSHSSIPILPFQVQVDPEDLIPKLPKPKNLQPFPTTEAVVRNNY